MGIPDILGSYKSIFYGIEVKVVKSVAEDGWAPRKKEHRFSSKQVEELKSIERSGGVGLAAVICGNNLYFALPDDINEYGQINVLECLDKPLHHIVKIGKEWDLLESALFSFNVYRKL